MKKQRFTRFFVKNLHMIMLFFLCVVILVLPHLLRESLIGDESYFSLRMAKQINEGQWYDHLSYGGRENTYILGWPILLSFFGLFLDLTFVSKALPFVLGIASFLLFSFILKELRIEYKYRLLSAFFLIFSPSFIYVFSVSQAFSALVFLSLLGFYLFLRGKYLFALFGFALFPFFDFFAGALALFLFSLYIFFFNKSKKKWLWFFLFTFLLVTFAYQWRRLLFFGLPEPLNFSITKEYLSFVELGSTFGISIFGILFALFGFVFFWKSSKKIFLLLLLLSFFILGFFFSWSLFFLNFFLAFFGAYGLFNLVKMKWESHLIKRLSLLILIGGFLFSTIFYLQRLNEMEPTPEQTGAFLFLRRTSDEDTAVFSHYSKGFWINALSERKNIMDANFLYAPDVNRRYNWSESFLHSTRLEENEEFLATYPFLYIYIDDLMRKRLWKEEDEGLLYLFSYSNQFKRVYKNKGVEIWKIKRTEE